MLEGYWSYEHMIVQLEDIVDCINFLHPKFDVVVLVDHSNGHDRLQPDGLNINRINIKHAGKQPRMQNAKITPNLLGPFHTSSSPLQVGMSQSMQYTSTDPAPCYLTAEERIKHKYDINLGEKRFRNKNVLQLKETLKATGVLDPKQDRNYKKSVKN